MSIMRLVKHIAVPIIYRKTLLGTSSYLDSVELLEDAEGVSQETQGDRDYDIHDHRVLIYHKAEGLKNLINCVI